MTLKEYEIKAEVQPYKELEKQRNMHWQAYLNQSVTATEERNGKMYSKYPEFKDFFDYEDRLKELDGTNVEEEERELTKVERLMLQVNS